MTRKEQYVARVKKSIRYCENCQPRDREEDDGILWIQGIRTEFSDLLWDLNIPERYHTEVAESVECPTCGSTLDLYVDVGVEFECTIKFEKHCRAIRNNVAPDIEEFSEFITRFPYLGAIHRVGRRLIKEIDRLPTIDLVEKTWYRGRRVSTHQIFTIKDMLPPDAEQVSVGEGRFNHHGQSHYYLGSSPDLCLLEITSSANAMCWVQEISIAKLPKIIDLSEYLSEDNYQKIPLTFSGILEMSSVSKGTSKDKSWKPEYFVPRFIADVCRSMGINGIQYNSSVFFGSNLVVFDMGQLEYKFVGEPKIHRLDKKSIRGSL